MILLAAVIVAFIVALATGGRMGRLADLPLRAPWLAVLGFGLQVYMIYAPSPTAPAFFSLPTLLLLLSYGFLLACVWLNRRLPGMWLIGLGLAMNLAVMLANGGYMPISPEAVAQVGHQHELQTTKPGARLQNTKDVLLEREQTDLWFLSDVFVVAPPFPIPSVFSPGDVMLALGAFVLIFAGTRRSVPAGASPPERLAG